MSLPNNFRKLIVKKLSSNFREATEIIEGEKKKRNSFFFHLLKFFFFFFEQ